MPTRFTHRGITLALLSRHEEALPNYNRALSLKPGDIEILYTAARRCSRCAASKKPCPTANRF
jgi:hypothetical protein